MNKKESIKMGLDYTVQCEIEQLKIYTKELTNLNELGIYLAKQDNSRALKTLKLMLLAHEANYIRKDFDLTFVLTHSPISHAEPEEACETVVSNLAFNPHNLALDLMEYIIRKYPVDFSIKPSGVYTFFELWMRSFQRIEYDEDPFYRRYDMVDKKLNIIKYLVSSELLNPEDIDTLYTIFSRCIENPYGYSLENLRKMEDIRRDIRLRDTFSSLKGWANSSQEALIDKAYERVKMTVFEEEVKPDELSAFHLEEMEVSLDMHSYIQNTVPDLIRQKKIK